MNPRTALAVSILAAIITLGACDANNTTTVTKPSTGATSSAVSAPATSTPTSSPASESTVGSEVASASATTVSAAALATLDQTVTQINGELAATDADLSSADSAIARGD